MPENSKVQTKGRRRRSKFARTISILRECFSMSMKNIIGNKGRSFLTVLGILIGVMAVITLITTVSGVTGSVTDTFLSMGSGQLNVTVTGSDSKSGLTTDDLAVLQQMNEFEGVTPNVSVRARVSRGSVWEKSLNVSGKTAYYFSSNPDALVRGRAINPVDEDNQSQVCVIDSTIIEEFFYATDPIGESLYIGGMPFEVVGIVSDNGSSNLISLLTGTSDIFIPYTTAMRMNSTSVVNSVTLYQADGVNAEQANSALESKLDELFSYEEDCYTISDMSSIEDSMNSMTSMMNTLLGGIAAISLLVGGIGIMNMMLTTVSERTVEIGLKKALGAKPWEIQIQFLIESFLLSLIGGLLGAVLGVLLSILLSKIIGTTFVLSVGAITLGVGFSAAIGIIFGWTPAMKASRLNPIDALRSM